MLILNVSEEITCLLDVWRLLSYYKTFAGHLETIFDCLR